MAAMPSIVLMLKSFMPTPVRNAYAVLECCDDGLSVLDGADLRSVAPDGARLVAAAGPAAVLVGALSGIRHRDRSIVPWPRGARPRALRGRRRARRRARGDRRPVRGR